MLQLNIRGRYSTCDNTTVDLKILVNATVRKAITSKIRFKINRGSEISKRGKSLLAEFPTTAETTSLNRRKMKFTLSVVGIFVHERTN